MCLNFGKPYRIRRIVHSPIPSLCYSIQSPDAFKPQISLIGWSIIPCAKACHPHFERSYLAHSFACQVGKGNHRAVRQAQRFSRRFQEGWFLKMDIRHCFETIDHELLMKRIQRRIGCPDTLWLTDLIIAHGGVDGKGLPIGNLTSQHFANFFHTSP